MTKLPEFLTKARAEGGEALSALQQEMNRLFEDFSRTPVSGVFSGFPKLDMCETDKTVELEVEMPGLGSKDVDLTIDGAALVISGERKRETEDLDRDYIVKERSWGAFSRRVVLPFEPAPSGVKATFEKGQMHVTIDKAAIVRPTTVKVEVKSGR
jgi:HSP20 family protein